MSKQLAESAVDTAPFLDTEVPATERRVVLNATRTFALREQWSIGESQLEGDVQFRGVVFAALDSMGETLVADAAGGHLYRLASDGTVLQRHQIQKSTSGRVSALIVPGVWLLGIAGQGSKAYLLYETSRQEMELKVYDSGELVSRSVWSPPSVRETGTHLLGVSDLDTILLVQQQSGTGTRRFEHERSNVYVGSADKLHLLTQPLIRILASDSLPSTDEDTSASSNALPSRAFFAVAGGLLYIARGQAPVVEVFRVSGEPVETRNLAINIRDEKLAKSPPFRIRGIFASPRAELLLVLAAQSDTIAIAANKRTIVLFGRTGEHLGTSTLPANERIVAFAFPRLCTARRAPNLPRKSTSSAEHSPPPEVLRCYQLVAN